MPPALILGFALPVGIWALLVWVMGWDVLSALLWVAGVDLAVVLGVLALLAAHAYVFGTAQEQRALWDLVWSTFKKDVKELLTALGLRR